MILTEGKIIEVESYSPLYNPYNRSEGGGRYKVIIKKEKGRPYFFLQELYSNGTPIDKEIYLVCQVISKQGIFQPTETDILKHVTLVTRQTPTFAFTSRDFVELFYVKSIS